MSDTSDREVERAKTVLRWHGISHREHRIQVKQIPGSAHWHILKDSRKPAEDWKRDWATEASTKPDFTTLTEMQ